MSYLTTKKGSMLFSAYLKPFDEATKRVYRSEIQQFFDFAKDAPLAKINSGLIQGYREKIGKGHTAATTKRKFSILNGFFKLLEKKEKRFTNPITSLKELRTRTGADSEELQGSHQGLPCPPEYCEHQTKLREPGASLLLVGKQGPRGTG